MTVQPHPSGGLTASARHAAGGVKAKQRLAMLGFDPIQELVDQYRALQGELLYQEGRRDGVIKEFLADGIKERSYNAEYHLAIYDKLTGIADKLLRYGYGRVPETTVLETLQKTPMIINLTKKGATHVINPTDFEEPHDNLPD